MIPATTLQPLRKTIRNGIPSPGYRARGPINRSAIGRLRRAWLTDIFKGCLRLPILFPLAIIILMGTGANPFIVASGSNNPSALYAEQNQVSVTDQNGDVSPGTMDDADRDTSPPETEFYFGDSNRFNENDTHLFNNAF
ncbi:MAG: hypothetical protein KDK30_18295, partial [Leptospiraceae bacterium]|nr:hypothetical protein [Leptospiraceae bacterium]